MQINVGIIDPCTQAMGPGKRLCIWVRGCSLHCEGCGTPEFISPSPSGMVDTHEILTQLHRAKEEQGIEGVSFSGGEPFEQAQALALIAHEARLLGLSTLAWSGYTRTLLESARSPTGSHALLSELDVLIDGPFVKQLSRNGLVLRGSSNQKIHRLTERFTETDLKTAKISIVVNKQGVQITGVMDYELSKAILALTGCL